MIAALAAVVFFRRWRIFFAIAAGASILLILFDQTRLQPWVYQYLLVLGVLALAGRRTDDDVAAQQTLGLVQILIAGLYCWSGVQKMNFTFSHETLSLVLAPLGNLFPSIDRAFGVIGAAIAVIETLIGAGLLFRKTRRFAVVLAVIMHLTILALLIAKDHNRIVWIWNAALIALVAAAFWKSDVSLKQTFSASAGWPLKFAKTLVGTVVLLPVLSFFGLWDMYLSGALYSGSVEVAVIRLDEDLFGKLPPKAQRSVFQTKTNGERMLPLFEWAIDELNVPVYPEERVFRRIGRDVCRSATDKNGVELIVKQRPAVFDGAYRVLRINCAELERR